ncbi:hypothetical protein WMF45_08485 [Sorangium sp. So ce448]|uniref:hypothetical protein n=1 Tax=Sorangium sp. So ce448 TaxID=3133314 RepID=UPI003F614943
MTPADGVHDLCLRFAGNRSHRLFNLDHFDFKLGILPSAQAALRSPRVVIASRNLARPAPGRALPHPGCDKDS